MRYVKKQLLPTADIASPNAHGHKKSPFQGPEHLKNVKSYACKEVEKLLLLKA